MTFHSLELGKAWDTKVFSYTWIAKNVDRADPAVPVYRVVPVCPACAAISGSPDGGVSSETTAPTGFQVYYIDIVSLLKFRFYY